MLYDRFAPVDFSKNSEGGIQFYHGSWQEALSMAQKENKLIFLDVYASWCGPCRSMKRNTFSSQKVGDFYNRHFINVALDAEKGEGIALANRYKVSAYPTLLFINPDGQLVQSVEGYKGSGAIIEIAENILKRQ